MKNSTLSLGKLLIFIFTIYVGISFLGSFMKLTRRTAYVDDNNTEYNDKTFYLITTPENKVLEDTLNSFARKKGFELSITYADNLEIVDILNNGQKYDAIWSSNSIWLDMIDSSVVSTSNLKSTSITPIAFGIKKSKVEKLGLKDKKVTMNDLLNLIKNGELTFSMANPVTTNSGASSYLNILSTLAGNPEVLTTKHLANSKLQEDMKKFFQGLKRTSGDEDFLEESFVNGDYDAAITYESSIININKKLEKEKKETLYAIYPVDGVSICDSPLVYINNKSDYKKEKFQEIQSYILSSEGQNILLNLGRRTWYGGTSDNAPKDLFKKEWGIDTTKYISPVKYPSKEVIKEALLLYQTKLRKPVHVVFCLDYSGSMYGDGIRELNNAMDYIFSDKASVNMIQFSSLDKIDVLAFASKVELIGSSKGNDLSKLLEKIREHQLDGATSLYPAAKEALTLLKDESNEYNTSIILMTDGDGNIGTFKDLESAYKSIGKEIPIYGITFGSANLNQLNQMATLTNGKVFDGKTNLLEAFKTVRGYN